MTHSLRYTRLSLFFDEMSLAADSDERKLYRRLLASRLSTIYIGKQVASRFGQMVRRNQDRLILIPFGNRVYHFRKSVSFNVKGPRKPELSLEVSNQENRRLPFQTFVCVRNFLLKRRKQPETEFMVSLAKHQRVLLVCFNGSYIESCSSFMIHTRFHTSI